jgi:hypothetical protein
LAERFSLSGLLAMSDSLMERGCLCRVHKVVAWTAALAVCGAVVLPREARPISAAMEDGQLVTIIKNHHINYYRGNLQHISSVLDIYGLCIELYCLKSPNTYNDPAPPG